MADTSLPQVHRSGLRRYLALIQDPRGYGKDLEPAPPEGPAQPVLFHVVKAEEHEAEVARLRQGLWDCAIAAGMDHDGDLTPDHCVTDVVEVALREVRQLSNDYDEALGGGLA